jgi:hypothetical protein
VAEVQKSHVPWESGVVHNTALHCRACCDCYETWCQSTDFVSKMRLTSYTGICYLKKFFGFVSACHKSGREGKGRGEGAEGMGGSPPIFHAD